jgi:hypothetical protein
LCVPTNVTLKNTCVCVCVCDCVYLCPHNGAAIFLIRVKVVGDEKGVADGRGVGVTTCITSLKLRPSCSMR